VHYTRETHSQRSPQELLALVNGFHSGSGQPRTYNTQHNLLLQGRSNKAVHCGTNSFRLQYSVLYPNSYAQPEGRQNMTTDHMQICSFLPSATEILYALGLGSSVAGVTFECDFPPEAAKKTIVVNTNLAHDLTSAEIDRDVSQYSSHGDNLYRIDIQKLEAIKPDLIVTQELCDVCAISTSHVAKAVHQLSSKPQVLSLTPHTLGDVLEDVLRVGEATGRNAEAQELVSSLRERIAKIGEMTKMQRPTVVCLEWLTPPFNGGHWIPEMIDLAGGVDPLGKLGKDSYRMEWDQVVRVDPDVVLVMPCGHNLEKSIAEYHATQFPDGWEQVKAVHNRRVYAVNASAYFSRPGPRLVTGLEIMYSLLQENQPRELVADSWVRL
jgi:iron complex transport system substrate-binding protein